MFPGWTDRGFEWRDISSTAILSRSTANWIHWEPEIAEAPVSNESLSVLLESVNSEESLLVFVVALAKDRREAVVAERKNPGNPYAPDARGWENTSIEDFLDAAAAWAASTSFGLTQGLAADNLWKRFAVFLYLGRIYE
jgi:hypothetical protein